MVCCRCEGVSCKTKQHDVVYDNGDDEWLVLKDEKIKILIEPGEVFGKSVAADTAVPKLRCL